MCLQNKGINLTEMKDYLRLQREIERERREQNQQKKEKKNFCIARDGVDDLSCPCDEIISQYDDI